MSTATVVSAFCQEHLDIFSLSTRNKALLLEMQNGEYPMIQQQQQQVLRSRHPSWASSSSSSSGGRPSPTAMISFDAAPGSPPMTMDVSRDRSSPISMLPQQMMATHPGAPGQQQPQQQPQHRRLDRSISEPVDRQSKAMGSVNSGRYKTELCRPFEENGYCKYGDKCQFAHGDPELRSLSRHPKYKTELCRTFHTIGFCPYGPRCHFIHNEDERRLSQISHMKQQQAQQVVLHQQQVVVRQQQPPITRQMSQPTPITQQQQQQRRAPQNFTLSLPPMVRDNLGSTADSPPASITGSPTMSPVSFASDDLLSMSQQYGFAPQLASTPPASAPAEMSSSTFTFTDYMVASGMPAPLPLDVHTQADPIASLAAGLQAARLAQHEQSNEIRDSMQMFSMPPSPPESLDGELDPMNVCESPLDVSRSLRLPIFSQLAVSSQN